MPAERRSSYRALIVENDESILRLVKVILERENFIVEGARHASEAIALLGTASYELLIVDLILPEIGGEAILDYLEEKQPNYLRRVIVTTTTPESRIDCAFLQRICRLLTKPFDVDELVLIARECADDGASSESHPVDSTAATPGTDRRQAS